MNILGLSAFYHDSAACLVRDGDIVAAAQEERFTRKKHDPAFPAEAVGYCLREAGIALDQVDLVAFYDKPLLKFGRLLRTQFAYAPRSPSSFETAMSAWLGGKLWTESLLREQLGGFEGKILFMEHHQSHAASAFFPSPFGEAAVLTMDGVGEWATTSWGVGRGNELSLLAELRFPHSLGMLYSAMTYYTGFKVNSGEYKVMGLAPYGEPKYADLILRELLDLKEDGSFKLDMSFFDYCVGSTMTNEKFHRLFGGPPRKPESEISQREMDLARSVQDVTEEIMLRMARHVRRETGVKNLCMAGGVALNCVGNGKILRDGAFDRLWIQPAAGDAGGALGAALLAWHGYVGKPRAVSSQRDSQRGSLLGPAYSDSEIERALKRLGAVARRLAPGEVAPAVARVIADGAVVGWFEGRMEFGPRALGARSILGDPRNPEMQTKMNLKIKFRESFRPFAPAVLRERCSEYFDLDEESPYMLLVAPVREELRVLEPPGASGLFGIERLNVLRSKIPAVTHVDYSARVQTVGPEDNPLFYELLKEFHALTGCGVLINTSFNVRGEPIVCRPEEAYVCFMRTGMDYLLIGDFLLDKKAQPRVEENKEWMREFALD